MAKEKVYLLINSKATVSPDKLVYLKDIGEVYCTNENLKRDIEKSLDGKKNQESMGHWKMCLKKMEDFL